MRYAFKGAGLKTTAFLKELFASLYQMKSASGPPASSWVKLSGFPFPTSLPTKLLLSNQAWVVRKAGYSQAHHCTESWFLEPVGNCAVEQQSLLGSDIQKKRTEGWPSGSPALSSPSPLWVFTWVHCCGGEVGHWQPAAGYPEGWRPRAPCSISELCC